VPKLCPEWLIAAALHAGVSDDSQLRSGGTKALAVEKRLKESSASNTGWCYWASLRKTAWERNKKGRILLMASGWAMEKLLKMSNLCSRQSPCRRHRCTRDSIVIHRLLATAQPSCRASSTWLVCSNEQTPLVQPMLRAGKESLLQRVILTAASLTVTQSAKNTRSAIRKGKYWTTITMKNYFFNISISKNEKQSALSFINPAWTQTVLPSC